MPAVRALARGGASHGEIADRVGLTRVRVAQILATPDPDELLAEREAELWGELDRLLREREATSRSIAAIRRELDKIAGERATREIDRLLAAVRGINDHARSRGRSLNPAELEQLADIARSLATVQQGIREASWTHPPARGDARGRAATERLTKALAHCSPRSGARRCHPPA